MKKILFISVILVIAVPIIFLSCKKDKLYTDPGRNSTGGSSNKSPIANAGPNQLIILPTDSILLDGSASSDPDGTISEWLWTKISGPASFNINTPSATKTVVKNLSAGIYQFELKVKDNGGLFALDTIQVLVDDPNINQPPVANAGADQTITLPMNSVNLDGSGSIDPENNIVNYSWTKISGPSVFSIVSPNSVQTAVINLEYGIYQFELKVTDAGSLFTKDTVRVIVDSVIIVITNNPPVANAGTNQTIMLPTNAVNLDGSGSTDPENNITTFAWTKISGPSSYSISNPNDRVTQVTNLVQGVYLFELKVTDAGALFSKDTVQVTVNPFTTACSSGRPLVNAQLVQIGSLSPTRPFMTSAAAGSKIVFAGGSMWPYPPFYATSRVNIYDTLTQTWSTAELSVPRWQITTVTAGNKIFFAGGGYYDDGDNAESYKTVDIYDVSTNTWSVDSLSEPRYDIAAATVGNKVFFAGGIKGDNINNGISNKVDIYDLSTNSWSTALLSEARCRLTAVTTGNKIYFAGGHSGYNIIGNNNLEFIASNRIDIYDNVSNSWSTSSLSEPRYYLAGITVDNKIYWAGGFKTNPSSAAPQYHTCTVEIKDINTQNSSFAYLFKPRNFFIAGGQNAVVKNNKIIFFTGSRYGNFSDNKFDIYDISTSTWSIGLLPQNMDGASIISTNNTIYLAGGRVNGVISNAVWKLEF